MAVIAEGADVHTLIVVFTVEPDKQGDLVTYLEGVAAEHSKEDGFISCSVHRSEDGLRVAEYIQWESKEHLQALMARPEMVAHVSEPSRAPDVHSYQVVSVTEVSASGA